MRAKLPYLEDVIMAFWKIRRVSICGLMVGSESGCTLSTERGRRERKEKTVYAFISFSLIYCVYIIFSKFHPPFPFSPFSRSQLKERTHSHSQPSVRVYSPSLFFKKPLWSHPGRAIFHACWLQKNPQAYYCCFATQTSQVLIPCISVQKYFGVK